MKTPEEWTNDLTQFGDGLLFPQAGAERFIERIQKDALSDPMAQTLDQHELELVRDVADRLERQLEARTAALDAMRAKWLEARRYLRAANKGAERNAQALALATTRYWDYRDSDRRGKERDEHAHNTVVWNWLVLSDEDLTNKLGEASELSSDEIRILRLLLKAMLGSQLRPRHTL